MEDFLVCYEEGGVIEIFAFWYRVNTWGTYYYGYTFRCLPYPFDSFVALSDKIAEF